MELTPLKKTILKINNQIKKNVTLRVASNVIQNLIQKIVYLAVKRILLFVFQKN